MITATTKKNNKKYIQPVLDSSLFKDTPKHFGGSYLKNSNPRTARPISTKNAMHVVLRSFIAKDELSLSHYKRRAKIEDTIRKQAELFNIKIYQMAINSNHIHLLIKLYTRESFSKFIKAVSGLIARITLRVERGKALGLKFWNNRPFSRIVEWSKGYFAAKEYVIRNDLESYDIIPYTPRRYGRHKYKCPLYQPLKYSV
jgi:REP element-mobilizing transposase RayT